MKIFIHTLEQRKTVNTHALEGKIGITDGQNRKMISKNTKYGNCTKNL